MTIREFMNAVIAMENVTEEMRAFAENEIVKLNTRNTKRAEKPSKTAIANEPIKLKILALLKEKGEVMTASAIAEIMTDYKVQKISALCGQLAKEEKLIMSDVKVKGKGAQKGYSVK